jgi:hypothetical protein
MNSIHRLGLAFATVATVATVGGAFVMQGYVGAQQAAAQAQAQATAQSAATDTQVVYVRPAAPAATVPAAGLPQVIQVIVPGFGDDGGSDH